VLVKVGAEIIKNTTTTTTIKANLVKKGKVVKTETTIGEEAVVVKAEEVIKNTTTTITGLTLVVIRITIGTMVVMAITKVLIIIVVEATEVQEVVVIKITTTTGLTMVVIRRIGTPKAIKAMTTVADIRIRTTVVAILLEVATAMTKAISHMVVVGVEEAMVEAMVLGSTKIMMMFGTCLGKKKMRKFKVLQLRQTERMCKVIDYN